MLNYHELTMNEPRDSPQRRKQFLVIAAIMVLMTIHAGLNAGVFAPLDIAEDTSFPGGEFVYKFMTKDYAASTGTLRTVSSDLNIVEDGSNQFILEEGEVLDTADMLYSIFLDDSAVIAGGQTRFAAGLLLGSKAGSNGAAMKRMLLDVNKDIEERVTKEDGGLHSKDVKYEVGSLPKVNAAAASHPFTAGAWSALLQSFKIIPKFKEYAKEHGESGKSPVIIATCSAKQKMCTYYMPLTKRDKFFLGKPITEEYSKQFESVGQLERMGIVFSADGFKIGGIDFGRVFKGLKKAVGLGRGSSSSEEL